MKKENHFPILWTRSETAAYLKSSLKTIDRHLKDQRFKTFKIGRRVLIYAETVTEENINCIKPRFNS